MQYKTPYFPPRVEIELSSTCNLQCSYCPRRYLEGLNGFLDFSVFKKIIDEICAYPETIIVLHRRGESMLNPQFNGMLRYIAGKFKEVQMATNATLLDKDRFEAIVNALTFISFSFDAPDVYETTRKPAKYHVVEKKIQEFLQFNKGRVKTQISMVKTENTDEANIEIFKELWHDKVDRVRIYEEHSKNGLFGSLASPRKERKPCVMPVYEILIYSDGKVGRCNHDWNGDPIADVTTQTIAEIWHCDRYNDLRNQHINLDIYDPVCKNCDSWYPEFGVQGTGEVVEKQ